MDDTLSDISDISESDISDISLDSTHSLLRQQELDDFLTMIDKDQAILIALTQAMKDNYSEYIRLVKVLNELLKNIETPTYLFRKDVSYYNKLIRKAQLAYIASRQEYQSFVNQSFTSVNHDKQ